ncbi:MAG TPA: 50S ribosomal protein L16 [Phycisphaerae bacterium]|nr:50S ribosomal protein L16 [Phycisphaerae bacterium]HRR87403.1 50S ribosomal protein L16 [Phycisphaerae bacterium]
MALMPKRMKYRKSQRGRVRGVAHRGNTVAFGEYGLQSLETGWLTARQIEAGRMCATHFLHRQGRVYIRVFPHKPVSGKPLETRMGKGKGEPEYYVAVVREGAILFELGGVTEDAARRALARVAHKMPFRCRFVARRHAV